MINRFIIAILLLALSGVAWAGTEFNKIKWEDLSAQEQTMLEPFQDKWDGLPPGQQWRIMKGLQRWNEMSKDERSAMKARFKQWQELPEDERNETRKRFERFNRLSADEQKLIKDRYRWYQDLPAERRNELKQRWKNLTPKQKQMLKQRIKRNRGNAPGQNGALRRKAK